jgi:hypothetical protein
MPKPNQKKSQGRTGVPKTKSKSVKKQNSISVTETPYAQSGTFTNKGTSIHLNRTELVCSVDTGAAPAGTWKVIPLSVGITTSFPWLSTIANSFEYFELHALTFHYLPNVAYSFTGTVAMGIDYDAGDKAPNSLQELGTWEGTVSGGAYLKQDIHASREHLSLFKNRMVEASSGAVANDPRLNSCGNFYYYGASSSAAFVTGYLYVTYDVTLKAPQLGGPIGGSLQLMEPSAVSASTRIIPFLNDIVKVSDAVSSFLDVYAEGGNICFKSKRPFCGRIDVGVPPTSAGTVFPTPIGGTVTKIMDGMSRFYGSALQNTGITTTAAGLLSYLFDSRAVGDIVKFTGGTGSTGAWGAGATPTITLTELPRDFSITNTMLGLAAAWTAL